MVRNSRCLELSLRPFCSYAGSWVTWALAFRLSGFSLDALHTSRNCMWLSLQLHALHQPYFCLVYHDSWYPLLSPPPPFPRLTRLASPDSGRSV